MLPKLGYARPRTKAEALELLAAGAARPLAGGTDLLGCLIDDVFEPGTLVSLGRLPGMGAIEELADGSLSIGALVTIDELSRHAVVEERYPGLAAAALSVASPQLRNQGTVGGNLCQRPRCWYYRGEFDCAKKGGDLCYAVGGENRYHAIFGGGPCYIVHPSDTAPMLLALGAAVEVESAEGRRTLPVEELYALPAERLEHETVLEPGEMITRVVVPPPPPGLASSYRKVRERMAWDFALTSVALAVARRGARVESARIVLGGVAPIPWRVSGAEAAVLGTGLEDEAIWAAADAAVEGAEPLEQNAYKVKLVRGAVVESLRALR